MYIPTPMTSQPPFATLHLRGPRGTSERMTLRMVQSAVIANSRQQETENPEYQVQVTFSLGQQEFFCRLKQFEIIHDGIHRALPEDMRRGRRLILRGPHGEEVYPDMFAGEVAREYGTGDSVTLSATLEQITSSPGPWRNIGFDHLAIVVIDREGAYRFFTEVLGMQEMRHDPHMTVLTTGHTGLFLFDSGDDVPMSDGKPSRWHHLGFVVDSLDHAYWHLQQHAALVSDFTLLERQERWSLYGHYRNGDVNFMIQLSEIREGWKGFDDPASVTEHLYDYSARRYGKRL
jgi:catechol 2,3-dioxygenase-like lactoylglutathione lyase family enzyme